MTPTFSVVFYVNGELSRTITNLQAGEAYTESIPVEALHPDTNFRWHVMLRSVALEKLQTFLPGETLRVCWQDASLYNSPDTQHILIMKESFDRRRIQFMNDFIPEVENFNNINR
jgi:hypothetical protein